jgi:hypothetical protein
VLGAPPPRTRFLPPSRARSLACASVILTAAGCAGDVRENAGSAREPVVYGNDDRQDVFAFRDQRWAAQAADFAVTLVSPAAIDDSDPDNILLPAPTLEETGVCPDERFADQPTAGFCSGTLIAPDLVLTAGHCVSASDCDQTAFVFNYYMTDDSTLHAITSDDVYTCSEVLVNLVADSDYSVVRLDRDVVGHTPAPVAADAVAMPASRRLLINGYPSGLPLKIDNGGRVRDPRADTLDFFVANLDTFGGNSGSGVFDNRTHELVGVLVRGEQDYVADPVADCLRVNVCRNGACSGEDSTYAFRAIEALCASGAPARGLCPCGDGTCDAAGGESTATCPLDCGTECGDGTCNGDESPVSCPQDCGTCGNGACDGDETEDDCCTDCGCGGEGDVCVENECVPDPFPGDTCEQPLELAPQGTQTITGDTSLAGDDLEGSCVGAGAPDRVYTFTLAQQTSIDAQSTGFDTGLYLRSACDDAGAELACNDDDDPPGELGSRVTATLDPGTYYLVVDGFDGEAVGGYTLTVTFACVGEDADGDGTCDATDGCPADPAKSEPGVCGCGASDEDTDGDSAADCVDPCPADPGDQCAAADSGAGDDGAADAGATDDGSSDDGSDDGADDDGSDSRGGGGGSADDGGCSASGRDGNGSAGGSMVSLWLLGMGAFGLRRRPRGRQIR